MFFPPRFYFVWILSVENGFCACKRNQSIRLLYALFFLLSLPFYLTKPTCCFSVNSTSYNRVSMHVELSDVDVVVVVVEKSIYAHAQHKYLLTKMCSSCASYGNNLVINAVYVWFLECVKWILTRVFDGNIILINYNASNIHWYYTDKFSFNYWAFLFLLDFISFVKHQWMPIGRLSLAHLKFYSKFMPASHASILNTLTYFERVNYQFLNESFSSDLIRSQMSWISSFEINSRTRNTHSFWIISMCLIWFVLH